MREFFPMLLSASNYLPYRLLPIYYASHLEGNVCMFCCSACDSGNFFINQCYVLLFIGNEFSHFGLRPRHRHRMNPDFLLSSSYIYLYDMMGLYCFSSSWVGGGGVHACKDEDT